MLSMNLPIGDNDDDDFQNPIDVASVAQKFVMASCKAPKNISRRKTKPDRPRKKPKVAAGKTDQFSPGEPKLSVSGTNGGSLDEGEHGDFVPGTQLNALIQLCIDSEESNGLVDDAKTVGSSEEDTKRLRTVESRNSDMKSLDGEMEEKMPAGAELEEKIACPICGEDITSFSDELRSVHSNECIEKQEVPEVINRRDDREMSSNHHMVEVTPVLEWLKSLDLSRYGDAFAREEIDWDTLQWLTEEDLLSLGITNLGPRRKIVSALNELRRKGLPDVDAKKEDIHCLEEKQVSVPGNKLITEFFLASPNVQRKQQEPGTVSTKQKIQRATTSSATKGRRHVKKLGHSKLKDTPTWCCIPGTPFRVDAFQYLRGDCSDWFLTHFHTDHYQGLTRGFCHGKIYCSSITARLVNMKIGVPLDRIEVLPLNKKINIKGIGVTCMDANHCPGSIIILFEPPNGKPVLHTGDFRYCEEMTSNPILRSCCIHTLILDTTYCNPQYDFPKQDAVIQFVIDAIQAEAFNPKTLFLIGTYTIGKEKLFLEVARILRKKIYVGAAKLQLLECLELAEEDRKWFTSNEQESHIHVVPMWMLASFKRMKYISNQYSGIYDLIVAFSPTGWTFGKGKKKSTGRRWQQGTVIRYEVPYSEHCSFSEMKDFVQSLSPEKIIPSVNNDGPESEEAMVALLKA
ncbi:DNA cross-link repair 1A protein [Nymphaea thermarum]|nr:DNA cross-link repair 1A protein [Nymphaea thermarum]